MRTGGRLLLAAGALALLCAGAHAQSSLGIGNAEAGAPSSLGGPLGGLFNEVMRLQRLFFAALREALVAVRADGLGGGAAWLVALSFGYGVFHAAGPGHGKAVLSAYLLANERERRRGVLLSFAAAGVQALAALVVVGAGWFLLRGASYRMSDLATLLERLSYAGVALLGLWLLVRALRRATRGRLGLALPASRGGGGPGAALAFAGAGTFTDAARTAPARLRASPSLPREAVCERSAERCGCGRDHMVDPRLAGRGGWREGAATVLAIGLRPCAGAVVVLTFSLVNGLWLAGALAVAAMALGTAITVSAIALVVVTGKGGMLRLARARPGLGRIARALEIAGAALLLLIGLGLLRASL